MAGPLYFDRVMESSSTISTGTYALNGTLTGYQSFAAVGNGNTCYYCATDVDANGLLIGGWEVGLGTYATGGLLARTTILASSNGGAAVNRAIGTRRVFLVLPAANISSAIGQELDYVEFTTPVNPNATTEATADTVVTGSAVAYDGSTTVVIEFFCPNARPDATAASRTLRFWLYEDGTSIGDMGLVSTPAASASNSIVHALRRITPSNASHTYSVRASVSAGTGLVNAGAGGNGNSAPGFIRITRK